MSTTVYSQVLIYTAESTVASMERTKMPNFRNSSKEGFEPGLTWLRVRHSKTELPRSKQMTLAMIPCIFQISEESCWDLVAMDCIRYEESIDCRKRMSRISHICCNFSLIDSELLNDPDRIRTSHELCMHVGRYCLFFCRIFCQVFFWHGIYLEFGRYVIIRIYT